MGKINLSPIALCVAATALYVAASWNLGFIYDDQLLVLEQAPPRTMAGLFSVFWERHWFELPYYRPLAWLTLTAQKLLHGNVARPFHLFNAALAGVAGLVAYALLRLPVFRVRPLFAVLGCGIFALHPIASATVYPITARETSMVAIVMIASVYGVLRGGTGWRLFSLAGFAAALLVREQAVALPLLFVMADGLRWSSSEAPERRMTRGRVAFYLGVAAIALGYIAIRSSLFGGEGRYALALAESPLGPLWSVLYAVQSVFVPFVGLVYEPRLEVWVSAWRLTIGLGAVVAIAFAVWRAPVPARKVAVFWSAWFVVALLPTANLLRQETRFDERYLFLSLLGVVGVLAVVASGFSERAGPRRVWLAAGVAVLIGCASITAYRGRYYTDNGVFLGRWVETDPQSYQAQLSLGEYAFDTGRLDDAWRHLQEALRISPQAPEPHNVLGHISAQRGDLAGAVAHYETLLRAKPDTAKTHSTLGLTLGLQGDFARAERHCRRALELKPDLPGGHWNLGYVLELAGRDEASWVEYRREAALGVLEGLADHHVRLGNVFAAQGRLAQAERHFEQALRIDPRQPEAREALERVHRLRGSR